MSYFPCRTEKLNKFFESALMNRMNKMDISIAHSNKSMHSNSHTPSKGQPLDCSSRIFDPLSFFASTTSLFEHGCSVKSKYPSCCCCCGCCCPCWGGLMILDGRIHWYKQNVFIIGYPPSSTFIAVGEVTAPGVGKGVESSAVVLVLRPPRSTTRTLQFQIGIIINPDVWIHRTPCYTKLTCLSPCPLHLFLLFSLIYLSHGHWDQTYPVL